MKRFAKYLFRTLAALALLALLASLAAVLVFRSGWFRERVRTEIVEQLTRATGGQVDLGQFDFDWQRMTASVGPLVIHGKESATEQPFLRVNGVQLGLRIISALEKNVDLASVVVALRVVALRVVAQPMAARRFTANLLLRLVVVQ